MLKNFEFNTEQTGDILVSAYQELIDSDYDNDDVWSYCLRIENNSNERIRLMRKNLCLTDEKGNSYYDMSDGFNGELPDLEPGEYFEFEDTAKVIGSAAVLYGFCSAVTNKGKELKIKLPVINLSSSNFVSGLEFC